MSNKYLFGDTEYFNKSHLALHNYCTMLVKQFIFGGIMNEHIRNSSKPSKMNFFRVSFYRTVAIISLPDSPTDC